MEKKIIYTDGSCFPNPGFGGWAFVEYVNDQEFGIVLSGSEMNTTNNRMEYRAAIEAIKHFRGLNIPLEIRTDSQLLVKTCTEWMWRWERKKWCLNKSGTKKVKNLDLVILLWEFMKSHEITFTWVKGHSGHFHNEIADQFANDAASIK